MKNISKCRSQISGSTKDHFAGENEVCEILQTHKKGCEITSQQKADFAVVQKSSFSLEWSACNGCNSFVSTPNRAPFEALDFGLPKLWNGIYRVENGNLYKNIWRKISKSVGRNYWEASGEHSCTVQNGCEILAAKGWFHSCAKIFLQLGVICLKWL